MKKAFQISLAGTLFTIEDDAYAKLDGYITSVKNHFAKTGDGGEIVRDIEARMAEQLLETGKIIITMQEVDAVIGAMGKVEDFGGTEQMETPAETQTRTRKLYRNPDNSIIAGVSSGLGAYLNVDPLWVRITFVILTFVLNGFTILIYILFWIIMPEAKTAAQKLEMNGSPVTLETLGKNMNDMKEKASEVGATQGARIKYILSLPFVALGKVVLFIRKVFFPILKVLVSVILGIASLAALLAVSFLAPFVLAHPDRLADFPVFEVIPALSVYGAVIGGYIVLAIPALLLLLLAIQILSRKTFLRPAFSLSFLGVWIAAILLTGGSSAVATAAYQDYERTSPLFETITRQIPLEGDIEAVSVAHGQSLTIVRGNTLELIATGREKDMEKIEVEVIDGELSIQRSFDDGMCIFCNSQGVEFTLTIPGNIVLTNISARHGSNIEADIIAPEFTATSEHGANITLQGASEKVHFEARHGATIDALEMATKSSTAVAEHGATIRLFATNSLEAEARHGSSIRYKGNPKVTDEEEFGGEVRSVEESPAY